MKRSTNRGVSASGWPKSLGLYKAVEAACMYLRQNATQEFIGDARDTSQPTISRYTAALVPIVKSVLEEFLGRQRVAEAIEMVRGRVVLVHVMPTPAGPTRSTGSCGTRNTRPPVSIRAVDIPAEWERRLISGPLPGKTHDAKAFKETGKPVLWESGGGFGDKGYQGSGLVTPKEEAERRRADDVRIGNTPRLRLPGASRETCRSLQELEDIPLRLPSFVLYL